MKTSQFDLIIFGATSFVGQILCRYLQKQFGHGQQLHWAAAGRSLPKLENLRAALGDDRLSLIVADANDDAALRELCSRTRVLVSTVGPYALLGEPLVRACAESGTDYCDLTGEVQWIRRMVDRYEASARHSGARLVHCCGFDSIPSDMGVLFLQQAATAQFGRPCSQVKMRVAAMRGGFSGGTAASMINLMRETSANRELRRELANPYSICPAGHSFSEHQDSLNTPRYDAKFDSWTAPFMMASINTRIVHRSNALSDNAYGTRFRYDEAMLTGPGWRGRIVATSMTASLAALLAAGSMAPSRWLLERMVLPSPGEGPSEEQQHKGFFDLIFTGHTDSDHSLRVAVSGDRDPGYGATAKMLGQAAASLAMDIRKEDKAGGFWTPATIFDDRLIQRLRDHAGMGFTVLA